MPKKSKYDVVVIGSGPAGQKAALAASKSGKTVAVIEPRFIGGICTHLGTVPSKTFREAAIHLTNYRLRYMERVPTKRPSMTALVNRVDWVVTKETEVIENQLERNGIEIISGYGKYIDTHKIGIYDQNGKLRRTLETKYSVICSGTEPFLQENVPFDGKRIFYTDNILTMKKLPKSMTIVGGGIIGCEFCSIFSILGIKVNLVEKRDEILSLIDREMRANLIAQLDLRDVNFCLNDELRSIKINKNNKVEMLLSSGKILRSEMALFCTFRTVNTKKLNLDKVGVKINDREVIEVDENFRTANNAIFAAGDVVGHPALASTSFEQGRIAGTIASGMKCQPMSKNIPIGIYTIPEISYVGPSEKKLTKEKVPYSIGKSYFKETSRGAIMGALDGVLKIIFHQKTRKLLAIHVIGENAAELVHVGQAVIELGGTVDYFVEMVFNYPTLAETYKYAALSGINRLKDI